eukprot:10891759-Heterocapsa_arctica.AAC.1
MMSQRPSLIIISLGIRAAISRRDDDGGPVQLLPISDLPPVYTVDVAGHQDVEVEAGNANGAPSSRSA